MSLERFFIFKYLFLSISFSFYVKYICKKCYLYRSNGTKIHLDAALLVEILKQNEMVVRIKKANAILKCPVNKLFPIEYTYHDTN